MNASGPDWACVNGCEGNSAEWGWHRPLTFWIWSRFAVGGRKRDALRWQCRGGCGWLAWVFRIWVGMEPNLTLLRYVKQKKSAMLAPRKAESFCSAHSKWRAPQLLLDGLKRTDFGRETREVEWRAIADDVASLTKIYAVQDDALYQILTDRNNGVISKTLAASFQQGINDAIFRCLSHYSAVGAQPLFLLMSFPFGNLLASAIE
ncbi:hypothetical protein BJ742DRAFT_743411 [Cladochytrium replicatum]|nr:hypothetical protein BJ742DRAFT_743411 [Cladochytrium replicatum]